MPDPPTGTVTFLFTDIEGSSRLWEEYPGMMQDALVRHDELLREGIEAHGGTVFKTVGDAFCAAFRRASDALAAALSTQRSLHREKWREETPIKVRMALHTGETQERDGDYFGPPLNRVARILSAGHGGQVLLSHAAAELVRDSLPAGVELWDLGEQCLRDLARPERLLQLTHSALPAEFPPVRSLATFAHNLPVQLTHFIGRQQEIAQVKTLLQEARLLTVTGTGGCGKTRLALQVGADLLEDYCDGVWLVDLAPLTDPSLVTQAAASALRVPEEPQRPLLDTLVEALRAQHLLLLLDNCEHVVEAAAQMAERLLQECAGIRVLATSREALHAAGEVVWRLPSLPTPEPDRMPPVERLTQYDSVQLFIDRALAARPSFAVSSDNAPAVAQICYHLDGIPLAIELAAARVRMMSPEEIERRLDDRFRLLGGGRRTALPRQQTLRAAFDWSYDLLSQSERLLLQRLSVFVGGSTLEAAEQVCAGEGVDELEILDLLLQLVDKSLVITEEVGEATRYRMLETARQYARDRLREGEGEETVRNRHLQYFLTLAEQAEAELRGQQQLVWFRQLSAEHDNLRAALDWCEEQQMAQEGLRLGGALWEFWWRRGYEREGKERLKRSLELPGAEAPTLARAKALRCGGEYETDSAGLLEESVALYREEEARWGLAHALGTLGQEVLWQGGAAQARSLLEQSATIWRELGDQWGLARVLRLLGQAAHTEGDYARARSLLEQSIALEREIGDRWELALSLQVLGWIECWQGSYAEGRALLGESLAICHELGISGFIVGSLGNLGMMALSQGDYLTAGDYFQRSLAISREAGDRRDTARSLAELGNLALSQRDYRTARALGEESLALWRELGDRGQIAWALQRSGHLASASGDYARAQALYEEALAIHRERGDRHQIAWVLNYLGDLALYTDDYATARALYEEVLAIRRDLADRGGIAVCLEALGRVALSQDDPTRARSLYEEALAIHREVRDSHSIALSLIPLAAVARRQGDESAAQAMEEESLAVARASGRKPLLSGLLSQLGWSAMDRADPGRAQVLWEERLALSREMDDQGGAARSLEDLGSALLYQGDYSRARELLQEGMELFRRLGNPGQAAESLHYLADVTFLEGDLVRAQALFEECLTRAQNLGDRAGESWNLYRLGVVARARGDHAGAEAMLGESMRSFCGQRYGLGVQECTEGFAGLAAARGQAERAARLYGAAEAMREDSGVLRLSPPTLADYEEQVATLRTELGDEAFERMWSEGRAMAVEDAIAYALEP